MATPFPLPAATPAPAPAPGPFARWRTRALAIALAASLALHVAVTVWPVDDQAPDEPTVLTATITEIPAPPPPAASTPAPAAKAPPRPRRTSPLVLPLDAATATAPATPEVAPVVEIPSEADLPLAELAPRLAESVAPVSSPEAPPSIKTLPARVELAYRVYYGVGVHIGDASYRFEHANGRYRISTLGEARGLAALVLRGQGKVEVRGVITPAGLQPHQLSVERGSRDRREVATFDWESGIATLHEDRTAALELPTFDPLSLMWQFYFAPPAAESHAFTLVTTRRVFKLSVRREGSDVIEWPYGQVEAERWHRTSDDGRTESVVWLAPSLRYLPIKMRVTNTLRGTVDVVLAQIRVDDEARVE